MTEPKYKPILFTAPMVKAILEGRKTQTRRLNGLDDVNKIPDAWDAARVTVGALNYKVKKSAKGRYGATFISHPGAIFNNTINVCPQICPYGQPGDRLWVRENFMYEPAEYCWEASVSIPYREEEIIYQADLPYDTKGAGWTPSIHMPRWASRITLEITGVMVERLQDISEEDAYKEGAKQGYDYPLTVDQKYVNSIEFFSRIWNSIHGPGAWEENPWVWVVEFKRVEDK